MRRGVKALPGKTETSFEAAWKEAMFDYNVRAHLAFLQGSGSAGSASGPNLSSTSTHDVMIKKLENKLKNASEQIAGQKRRLEGALQNGPGKKGNKGRGKGKDSRKGMAPQDQFPGCKSKHNNKSICYAYNAPSGCPLAKAGGECHKGQHICIKCDGVHSYSLPCPSI